MTCNFLSGRYWIGSTKKQSRFRPVFWENLILTAFKNALEPNLIELEPPNLKPTESRILIILSDRARQRATITAGRIVFYWRRYAAITVGFAIKMESSVVHEPEPGFL